MSASTECPQYSFKQVQIKHTCQFFLALISVGTDSDVTPLFFGLFRGPCKAVAMQYCRCLHPGLFFSLLDLKSNMKSTVLVHLCQYFFLLLIFIYINLIKFIANLINPFSPHILRKSSLRELDDTAKCNYCT